VRGNISISNFEVAEEAFVDSGFAPAKKEGLRLEKQKAPRIRIVDECIGWKATPDEKPSDLRPGNYLVVPQFGLIHLAVKVELEFMA
jgi:hypothetical protein